MRSGAELAASAESAPIDVVRLERLYASMLQIRLFEEQLLKLYRTHALTGTTHTYVGQEAIAVAALAHLEAGDGVVSTHRCHGHYLAAGGDPRALFLEILGDSGGVCGGVGGSQHLHFGKFFSNGILGGTLPLATGIALAEKIRNTGKLAVCFMGDGALGEGVVYESFNIASLWNVPVLFVVEENGYAQSTPVRLGLAGSIRSRFESFGIETAEVQTNDVALLDSLFDRAFARVRAAGKPFCQIVHTYRLEAHSKGDDNRDPAEIAAWRERDPILLAERRLSESRVRELRAEAQRDIEAVFAIPEHGVRGPVLARIAPDEIPRRRSTPAWRNGGGGTMVAELRDVLRELLEERDDVHVLGEDILDPYGGAFKVTSGLSTRFPDRVWTTPVSEAAIVGVANGLALNGLRPVVELMFGDFSTLIVDQILNHATKFARMYGGDVRCPIIVRTPMGGRRGYGPTHSQSLEKLFLGVAGLTVVAADPIHDQRLVWKRMLDLASPCFYVENKALYGQRLPQIDAGALGSFRLEGGEGFFPTTRLSLGSECDAAIVAYGGLVTSALEAARLLFENDELIVDVVVPTCLSPLDLDMLSSLLDGTYPVLIAEEGTIRCGFGAEMIAGLADRGSLASRKVRRLAMPDTIVPNADALEQLLLPDAARIVELIHALLG